MSATRTKSSSTVTIRPEEIFSLTSTLHALREENRLPIHASSLARVIGVSERRLRHIVHAATVEHNQAILSGDDGYTLPESAEEAFAAADRLHAHAMGELAKEVTLRRYGTERLLRDTYSPTLFPVQVDQ